MYKQNHIPGSIYFDIEKISNSNSDLPHMFPSSEVFFSFTNKYGINKRSKIVIYDQIGFFLLPEFGLCLNILVLKMLQF